MYKLPTHYAAPPTAPLRCALFTQNTCFRSCAVHVPFKNAMTSHANRRFRGRIVESINPIAVSRLEKALKNSPQTLVRGILFGPLRSPDRDFDRRYRRKMRSNTYGIPSARHTSRHDLLPCIAETPLFRHRQMYCVLILVRDSAFDFCSTSSQIRAVKIHLLSERL